jgi:hypothetical protein
LRTNIGTSCGTDEPRNFNTEISALILNPVMQSRQHRTTT